MFNLIRKDILLQKPTLLILLPLLVVFLFLENSYVWIGIIFSISIVMNAYTIDEKSASHMLLNSLPYTRKEIVSSKYIGIFIFLGIIVSTIFLGNLIIHQEIMMWKDILVIASSVIVAISFLFPFSYQFKSQYMMIGALVSFAIYLVIIPLFIPDVNDKVREFVQMLLTIQTSEFYLIVALSVMVLYACSWLLSIRIYERKVF